MKDLLLNYQELAFIMEMPVKDSKQMFDEILGETPKVSNFIEASKLMDNFGITRSVDKRYDGINELIFNLQQKAKNYKKYLNDKSVIKKKAFGGGKKIFYKIMNDKQLEHFKEVVNYKHNFLYNKNVQAI